jgi:hypothetical protein
MFRYRVAYMGSKAAGISMAEYKEQETLAVDTQDELVTYYSSETEPLSAIDKLGHAVATGEMTYSEALGAMMRQEIANGDTDLGEVEWRASSALADAAGRAEMRRSLVAEGGTVAEVRPDMSAAKPRRFSAQLRYGASAWKPTRTIQRSRYRSRRPPGPTRGRCPPRSGRNCRTWAGSGQTGSRFSA